MDKYIDLQRIVTEKGVVDSKYFLCDKEAQAVFNDEQCAVIKDGGYIVLDFGKELNGGIVITTQSVSNDNAKYRIVFGESVMEALSELGNKNSGNHHSIRDMIVDAVFLCTQRFGSTGFRFVKLEAIGTDITVRAVKAVPEIRELDYLGSFECDDELLNKIWTTGAYTVQLNMHDYLWDGVKRDRLVWVGDMHPEISVIKFVFGDDVCVRKSLDFIKKSTPPTKWMNNIPTYSMWWIIIHYDWYMYWGDFEYLKEQKSYMLTLADTIFDLVDGDFDKENVNSWFVDWSSREQEGEKEGVISITCIALNCLKKIFMIFDEAEYAEKCGYYHKRLQTQMVSDDVILNNRICALSFLAGRESKKALDTVVNTTLERDVVFYGVLHTECSVRYRILRQSVGAC